MRRLVWMPFLLFAIALPGLAGRAEAAVSAEVGVDLSLFHDRLAVHGDWIHLEPHGWVWTPRHMAHGWRPYTVGHWAYTDCDWTWVSDEPWGWATYHYGRWAFDPSYGWVWVPDPVWGPAWVAWRSGGGFVGWAPLPPGIDVSIGDVDISLDPFAFAFVESRFLVEPALLRHVLPVVRNVTLLPATRNFTRYTIVNGVYSNHGVDVKEVERASGRAITRLRLRDVGSEKQVTHAVGRSGELGVYRPAVRPPAAVPTARDMAGPGGAAATRTVEHGDMEQRQQRERRELQSAEGAERERLRVLHEQENARRAAETSEEELRQRHRAEDEAQAEHEVRERRLLEARHQREREARLARSGGGPRDHAGRH
jgi:hypothetical protein